MPTRTLALVAEPTVAAEASGVTILRSLGSDNQVISDSQVIADLENGTFMAGGGA